MCVKSRTLSSAEKEEMQLISLTEEFAEVSEDDLTEYLKTCPDYTRDRYSGSASYKYRHNNHEFAIIKGDKCYVKKALLAT